MKSWTSKRQISKCITFFFLLLYVTYILLHISYRTNYLLVTVNFVKGGMERRKKCAQR